MKAVILAGGLGTRISEDAHLKPKPMVEISGKPVLWHIMKMYSARGVRDVNITELLAFHKTQNVKATHTLLPGRFRALDSSTIDLCLRQYCSKTNI